MKSQYPSGLTVVSYGGKIYNVYEHIEIWNSKASDTGTLTAPKEGGGTLDLATYEFVQDAYSAGMEGVVVKMAGGFPVDEIAETAAGVLVTVTSINSVTGDYVLSAMPDATPFAIIFKIKIRLTDSADLDLDYVVDRYQIIDFGADYLKVDQTIPQIITGLLEYKNDHPPFNGKPHALADVEYVQEASSRIGVQFFMLDAADTLDATYKQTSTTPSALGTASITASVNAEADTIIGGFLSPVGTVWTALEVGIYALTIFAQKTAGNREVRIFWEFYEYKADTSEVLIMTSNISNLITTLLRLRIYAALTPQYDPAVGSRLLGKLVMRTTGGSQNTTVEVFYQGTEASHWSIPVNKEFLDANYQAKLVSNVNIKTINSTSLLGAGDIVVAADTTAIEHRVKFNLIQNFLKY